MSKKYGSLILCLIILPVLLLTAGCGGGSQTAKNGNIVKVDYTGRYSDGTQFDTSIGKEPLKFTIGAEQVIPGFEEAVIGMKVGESKTVTIPADKAYGQRNEGLVEEVSRDLLSPTVTPTIGMQLYVTQEDGSKVYVVITALTDTTMTLDANNPMAGKDLTFDITLVEIVK
jgi:peptidylprolyl isomerase